MKTTLAQFNEQQTTERFALQNSKLLRVNLEGQTIQAKIGSMVGYQGEFKFEHAGSGGVGRFVRSKLTGEGQPTMKVTGRGQVFLADLAQDIHLVYLENDKLTVNGPNLLAFDEQVDWNIERVQGAGAMSGGLFNTTLQGTGWVALMSDGSPVLLDVSSAPTFADPQAVVAWSAGVQTSVKTDVSMKNLIGRGSGESFQMGFAGQGWVLVQPSEAKVGAPAGGSSGGGLGGFLNQ